VSASAPIADFGDIARFVGDGPQAEHEFEEVLRYSAEQAYRLTETLKRRWALLDELEPGTSNQVLDRARC
jgi:hypothetical protein